MSKPKILAVVGPTASGKTALAITLAQRFAGEVISADSRQVYRGLDEGTAKVTEAEMQGVPHHLIDICDIATVYTAADFKRDATRAITDIRKRNHLPIIAGGTFFYLDQLRGKATAPVAPNPTLRKSLETYQTNELFEQLTQQDPRRAAEIDPNNRRRLIRALEIVDTLGAVPEIASAEETPYEFCVIGIDIPKEKLRAKLTKRADLWLSGPFQAEVEHLLAQGISRDRLQEIGFEYIVMLDYIDGKLSKEDFIASCVAKNWQYAKRQMTWLKRDKTITWFTPDDTAAVIQHVEDFLS